MNKFYRKSIILIIILILIFFIYMINVNYNSINEKPSGSVLVYSNKGVIDY